MIVTVVHQRDALVFIECRIAQGEFRRTDRVSLDADAEDLGFDTRFDLVEIIGFLQDLIDGFPVSSSRAHPVSRNVLETVARPDIHDALLTEFFCQIFGDSDRSLAVFDPEFPGFLIR